MGVHSSSPTSSKNVLSRSATRMKSGSSPCRMGRGSGCGQAVGRGGVFRERASSGEIGEDRGASRFPLESSRRPGLSRFSRGHWPWETGQAIGRDAGDGAFRAGTGSGAGRSSSLGRIHRFRYRARLGSIVRGPCKSASPHVITSMRRSGLPTGWSDSCRAGFAPARKARLSTAHAGNHVSSTGTARSAFLALEPHLLPAALEQRGNRLNLRESPSASGHAFTATRCWGRRTLFFPRSRGPQDGAGPFVDGSARMSGKRLLIAIAKSTPWLLVLSVTTLWAPVAST